MCMCAIGRPSSLSLMGFRRHWCCRAAEGWLLAAAVRQPLHAGMRELLAMMPHMVVVLAQAGGTPATADNTAPAPRARSSNSPQTVVRNSSGVGPQKSGSAWLVETRVAPTSTTGSPRVPYVALRSMHARAPVRVASAHGRLLQVSAIRRPAVVVACQRVARGLRLRRRRR